METSVLTGNEIDFEKLSNLLLSSFLSPDDSELQNQEKMKAMSTEFLRHKYTEGLQNAKLAVAIIGDEYVACNGMVYVKLKMAGKIVDGWMSCDTATHPNFRGQGLFRKCIESLRDSLPKESVFFGYPNANSIETFKKFGWQVKHDYRIKVGLAIIKPSKSYGRVVANFQEFDCIFKNQVGVLKDARYLDWRYSSKRSNYVRSVSLDKTFFIVARKVTINKISFLLVLEFLTEGEDGFTKGVSEIYRIAWEQKCIFIISSFSKYGQKSFWLRFQFNLPVRLFPRKISLMGSAKGQTALEIWDSNWDLALGDWDVF